MTEGLRKKHLIISIAALLLFAALPFVVKGEYFITILFVLCLYTLLSQGWNILGGFCGQLNLGTAVFFGTGALACRLLWTAGLPYPFCLALGGLSSVALSCVIGIPALRLRAQYFATGTIALAMIGLITVQNLFPEIDILPADLMGEYNPLTRYYTALFVTAAVVAAVAVISRSRVGLALLCIRDDEDACLATGINIVRYKVIALFLSTFISGLAGGLFAYYYTSYYLYVPFDLMWSFEPVLITFIGGAGTILGPLIGSTCFVVLKEVFAISMGQINVLIFGVVFIIIVLFLPRGLIGIFKKVKKEGAGGRP